jgi:hypothetical protein
VKHHVNIAKILCAFAIATSALDIACAGAATEGAYTAALLRCVDKSATLAESKACRSGVDAQFGVKDGGAE